MSYSDKHEGFAKLSNRVMGMRFMKHAENKEGIIKEQERAKKLINSSEWSLNGSKQYLSRIKEIKVMNSVGFNDLNSFSISDHKEQVFGRRVFGNKKSENKQLDKKQDKDSIDVNEVINNTDLDELWSSQKNFKRKRIDMGDEKGNSKRSKKDNNR